MEGTAAAAWHSGAKDELQEVSSTSSTPRAAEVHALRKGSVGDMVKAFEANDRKPLEAAQQRQTVFVKLPSKKALDADGNEPKQRGQRETVRVTKPHQERRREVEATSPKATTSPRVSEVTTTSQATCTELVQVKPQGPRGPTSWQQTPSPGLSCTLQVPICRIEVQEGWVRVGLMFQDPCGVFERLKSQVWDPEASKQDGTHQESKRSALADAAGSGAVRATAVGALGGAAALGAAGAVGGASAGGSLGALAGLLAAPLTLGLSVPLGAAIGSGTGLCAGAVVGSSAGTVSGGFLGLVGYKCRGLPSAVLSRVGWGSEQAQEESTTTSDTMVPVK